MLGGSKSFDNRVRLIQTAHSGRGKGNTFVADRNGVLVAKTRRRAFDFPIKGLLYLVLGFAVFKAIAMAQLGGAGYQEKVDMLAEGTFVEQAGAVLMAPDPVSAVIAGQIAPYLR